MKKMKEKIKIAVAMIFIVTAINCKSSAQTPSSWTQKSSFGGIARSGAVGFSIGTKGYMGTGYGNGLITFNDFWEYDQTTDTWSQKADFPGGARTSAIGFSIGSNGYIGTGLDKADTLIGIAQKDFWEYSPSSNSWTRKADLAGPERYGAVGFRIGSKGYVGTGDNFDPSFNDRNDFWEYDPATDTWLKKANFAGLGRVYASGFSIGNKGYLGLGNTGTSRPKDFYEYDPDLDLWSQKANFGGDGRIAAFGSSDSNFGYIGLGSISFGNITSDFWRYNPISDTWNKRVDFAGGNRTSTAGFSIGNMVYLGTGNNNLKYLVDFWEFNTSCIEATISSQPTNQSVTYGTSANFTLTASDAVSFQWQEDSGTGFININDGGKFANTTTANLDILQPSVDMTGHKYRCIVTGPCLPAEISDGVSTLTVTAMDVSVIPDGAQAKVYGSPDPLNFSFTLNPTLVGSDGVSGNLQRTSGENVGEYSFTLGTLTAGNNYNLSVSAIPEFSITPALLTVTAENKEKCFDGAIFGDAYTANYNGFVNAENESVLGGSLAFGGSSITAISPGDYSIEASGLISNNYTFNYLNGILVIKPTPLAPIITRSGDSLISNISSGNQWYLDNIEIIGATDKVNVATVNGTYYSILSENGCSSLPSNSINVSDVSIHDLQAELFNIYPNPSNGILNIKMNKAKSGTYSIEVYNNLGSLIWSQKDVTLDGNNAKRIEINNLSSGAYTFILKNKAGSSLKKVFISK